MATSDLYGWFPTMSQPLTAPASNMWTIPERSPGAQPLNDRTAPNISTNFGMGPLSQLAYQMAGSPKRGPLAGVNMPAANYPNDDGQSGISQNLLGGALGGLAGFAGNLVNGGQVSSIFQNGASGSGLGNIPYGVISDDPRTGGISGNLPYGSGESSGLGSLAQGAGGALGIYSGIQQGGQEGAAQALLGAGKVAGAVGSSSALGGTALGSSLAASGASTALPLAGLGFIAADLANKSLLGDSSKDRNVSAYMEASGARPITLALGKYGKNYVALPDGRLVSAEDFNDLAGSWYGATYSPDGNQADWQAKYDEFSKNLQSATLPKGYVWNGTDIVRG